MLWEITVFKQLEFRFLIRDYLSLIRKHEKSKSRNLILSHSLTEPRDSTEPAAVNRPTGNVFPFVRAIFSKVIIAFSGWPDNTWYLGDSGNHLQAKVKRINGIAESPRRPRQPYFGITTMAENNCWTRTFLFFCLISKNHYLQEFSLRLVPSINTYLRAAQIWQN